MLILTSNTHELLTWHIDDAPPRDYALSTDLLEGRVRTEGLSLQVDGDELERIREQFPGLVIPKKRVVLFFGEMAKFIFFNL